MISYGKMLVTSLRMFLIEFEGSISHKQYI